jgi:hypothetical protein
MVRNEARKNFKIKIDAGLTLTMDELKVLGTLHKGDYIKHMLKEDDLSTQYLQKVKDQCSRKHQEISELIWGITDTSAKWESNIQQINTAIYNKAKDLGVVKKCTNCSY